MNGLVSVLLPAYNAAEFIEKSIRSILNQSYDNLELLILDDGSKDDLWKIINSISDKRIRVFRHKKNKGNIITLNFLIAKAKGDYITIQDADDWSAENRIEVQVKYMESHKDIMLCSTSYCYAKDEDNVEPTIYLPETMEEINQFIEEYKGPALHCATMFFRREVYEKLGFYKPYFNRLGAADFDWYYRVIENYKVTNINEGTLYFYRYNDLSITHTLSTDVRKLHSMKIAYFLHQERKKNGVDSLMTGKLKNIENMMAPFVEKYKKDKGLIYREVASSEIRKKRFPLALRQIFMAFVITPFNKANINTLRYWLWKYRTRKA